jgi:hypothetical protein
MKITTRHKKETITRRFEMKRAEFPRLFYPHPTFGLAFAEAPRFRKGWSVNISVTLSATGDKSFLSPAAGPSVFDYYYTLPLQP